MKGIIKVALFFTLKCEKGKMHEDKVRFDQVNNAAIGGVAHFGRQRSVNGGRGYLVEETLMSGTHGEINFTCLKGGQGIHFYS